jgi:predicted Zn-dependent peptidase
VVRVEERGVLPNGFRYLYYALPSVGTGSDCAVNLRIEAGANDEEEGHYGEAHLLEHVLEKSSLFCFLFSFSTSKMMFDQAGSIVGRNQVFLEFEKLGVVSLLFLFLVLFLFVYNAVEGYNAFTTFDATVLQAWNVPLASVGAVAALFRMQIAEINITQAHVAVELGAVLGEARAR